jgi:hypothetical protein
LQSFPVCIEGSLDLFSFSFFEFNFLAGKVYQLLVLFDFDLRCELCFGQRSLDVTLLEFHLLVVFECGGKFSQVLSESVVFKSELIHIFAIPFDVINNCFVSQE